jgi:RNA-directed DNA polymerase
MGTLSAYDKVRDAIRGKTPRSSGRRVRAIVADVNRTLIGWLEYFKPSHETVFGNIDGWVRMRLRGILRKRSHPRGRGRSSDHQRWPNASFVDLG